MTNELFRTILDAAWDTTTDVMMVVDDQGTIVHCNRQVANLLGWTPAELIGQTIDRLVPPSVERQHRAHVARYNEAPSSRRMGDGRVLFALDMSGTEVPVEISLSSVRHEGQQFTLAVIRDARKRFEYEEELRQIGFHDSLTGLYNRHYFDEELKRLQAGRTWPVGILVADVDGLKAVNDHFGHAAGDELLRRAGKVLSAAVRREDVVARIGGDEYAAILPGLGEDDFRTIYDRVLRGCESAGGRHALRISLGFAAGERHATLREVVRRADARMYEAKAARRRHTQPMHAD